MKVIISASPEKTTGTTPSLPQIPEEPSLPPAKSVPSFTPVQICEISANAFYYEMMRNDSEFFQTSIYEMDQIIQDKESEEDDETISLIREKLPYLHRKYTDVFSKSESNKIPPHRIYDHKIQLEAPLPNAFSPLYQQGTKELKATKQYLLENLEKGFIVNSNSPFASPILFVKKVDGKLRFCIDYHKLNGLTCNDLPTTVTGVKSYLGFCGFYRQFIRNFGKIAKPLTTITSPSEPFRWTEECENAFEELRRQLLAVQALHHFNPELPTKLETDSSDGVVAGVLSQEHPNKLWYPVSFYSHVLSRHEINWEIHDKELFAIVKAF
ncbi:hypothetical protein VE02_10361 [Pseudogymnoascus sp. 03VT05]|nr:hypothetical protein VE02_10361 [Pseudogymnoascus sp. 03VT05]